MKDSIDNQTTLSHHSDATDVTKGQSVETLIKQDPPMQNEHMKRKQSSSLPHPSAGDIISNEMDNKGSIFSGPRSLTC